MKIAVVGAGAVGAAVTTCLVHQGEAEQIVLIDPDTARAHALALDLGYGTPLTPPLHLWAGTVQDADGAELVLVSAGTNERAGGATDRSDPQGRLRLLGHNAALYRDLLPALGAVAPEATYIVITDPPDPLAQLGRTLLGHDRILSTGTIIEGLGASQYGIGAAVADLARCVLRDEGRVMTVASYNDHFGATLSLPSVVGAAGVRRVLEPPMSQDESQALNESARALREAARSLNR